MKLIDFNAFEGFQPQEDILVDTGVILAYLNHFDTWHDTISKLFETHLLDSENVVFLYINPTVLNEVTFLVDKPLERYARAHHVAFTDEQAATVRQETVSSIRELIEQEILLVLDGNKETLLKQLELFQTLGSADAVNAAIANEYGISFLTLDKRLAFNMKQHEKDLRQVQRVYYTESRYKSY